MSPRLSPYSVWHAQVRRGVSDGSADGPASSPLLPPPAEYPSQCPNCLTDLDPDGYCDGCSYLATVKRPAWTADERQALRAAIDERRREQAGVESDGILHGVETTYRHGCRCDPCREVATAARRVRRERARENDPRRQRLLAACSPDSTVDRRAQVRSVMRMIEQAARRNAQ